jgi:hypothetical protein
VLLLLNVLLFGMWRLLLHAASIPTISNMLESLPLLDLLIFQGAGPGATFRFLTASCRPVARGDRSRLGSPRSTPSAVGRAVLVSHLRVRQLGRRRRRCARLVGQSRNMLATTLRAVAALSALAVVHGASARGPR